MSINQQRICDRTWCGKPISVPYQTITVNYHHPRTLDLCKECEAEFMLWLGQHPLWGHSVQKVADGHAMGDGTPSRARAQEFLEEREMLVSRKRREEQELERHRVAQQEDGEREMAARRGSAPDSHSAEWG